MIIINSTWKKWISQLIQACNIFTQNGKLINALKMGTSFLVQESKSIWFQSSVFVFSAMTF